MVIILNKITIMLKIKRVHSEKLKEQVYQLRYAAYRREDSIELMANEKFQDQFDLQNNHVLWALTYNDNVIGSIRSTWYNPDEALLIPEKIKYSEEIDKYIPGDKIILSGNRFVTNHNFTDFKIQKIAMLLLRYNYLVAELKNIDWSIAAVRKTHLPFYELVLSLKRVSDAKIYPGLTCPMYLLLADYKRTIKTVYERNPILKPIGYERFFLDENYLDMWEVGLPVEM